MLVYSLNYLSVPLYQAIIKDKKKFVLLVSVQLFLLLALRAPTMGVDLGNYTRGFDFISTLSFPDMLSRLRLIRTAELVYPFSYESGYVVLNWIVAFFGGNFQTFLLVNALICMAGFGMFIYKHSDCPWLSFCIFLSFDYYKYAFGILRQTLAIAILLFALMEMEKRHNASAALLVFLAFTMHRSSLAFAVMFVFGWFVIQKIQYKAILAACALLFVTGPVVLLPLMKLIVWVVGREGYLKDVTGMQFNKYIVLIVLIAIAIYFTADFSKNVKGSPQNYLMGGFLMAIPVGIMGMYSENFGRFGQMFSIMMIALIPNMIQRQESALIRKLGKATVFVLMFGFMIYTFRGDEWLVPYRFFFG